MNMRARSATAPASHTRSVSAGAALQAGMFRFLIINFLSCRVVLRVIDHDLWSRFADGNLCGDFLDLRSLIFELRSKSFHSFLLLDDRRF